MTKILWFKCKTALSITFSLIQLSLIQWSPFQLFFIQCCPIQRYFIQWSDIHLQDTGPLFSSRQPL